MPIYEYRCNSCGREFEIVQGITEPEVKTCKFCQGPIRKLISLSTFHLKGGGWYVTDYGGKKAPSSEGTKSETATPPPAETTASAGSAPSSTGSENKSEK
jgi:putative FmdB family regulatory protein